MKMNKHSRCVTSFDRWDRPAPEQCIVVKGTEYLSLEVIKPWPVCENGTEAKFALFGTMSGTCDPKQDQLGILRPLLSKSDVLFNEAFATPKDKTEEGALVTYPTKGKCNKSSKPPPVVERHLPDTCIDIDEGLGLSFMSTAMCKNGTNAMIAGFKGKDCDPTNKPLDDPFTVWHPAMSGFFVPTDEINSMSFWCDGLPGVDMRKPNRKAANGPNLGLILGITIPVSVTFLLVMGFAVAYSINYHFRMKVKELFGSGDGYIAL